MSCCAKPMVVAAGSAASAMSTSIRYGGGSMGVSAAEGAHSVMVSRSMARPVLCDDADGARLHLLVHKDVDGRWRCALPYSIPYPMYLSLCSLLLVVGLNFVVGVRLDC